MQRAEAAVAPSQRSGDGLLDGVAGLLELLADPAKRPLYIHCMKGMDRTGVIVALHRVYNERWSRAKAQAERDAIGFNHWLGYLDRYFLWKAGRYHAKMPGWSLAARAS